MKFKTRSRRARLCGMASLLALGGWYATDVQAQQGAIAIAPPQLEGLTAEDATIVEEALKRGFETTGKTIVAPPEVRSRMGRNEELDECDSAACVSRALAQVQAGFWTRAQVTRQGDLYKLALTLYGQDGQTLANEMSECELPDCSLGSMVRLTAKEMALHALPAREQPVASVRRLGPAKIQDAPSRSPAAKPWAWTGFALGGGSLLTGVVLLAVDGNETDCRSTSAGNRCFELWDNKALGWGLAGAGAVVASVSAYVLWKSPLTDQSPRLSVGPKSVMISGRF